jgi:hypothetical protein
MVFAMLDHLELIARKYSAELAFVGPWSYSSMLMHESARAVPALSIPVPSITAPAQMVWISHATSSWTQRAFNPHCGFNATTKNAVE